MSGRSRSRAGTARRRARTRYTQLAEEPGPLPDSVPKPISDLIFDLLDPDPGERPSCAEVVERLEPEIARLPRKMKLSRRGAGV